MTIEPARELARLGEERARLEVLLARHPAWVALRECDRQPAAADASGNAVRARLRADLERQLSGNPVFEAHRSVVQAIAVIESAGVGQKSADEMETPAHVEAALSPERAVPTVSPHAEALAAGKSMATGGVVTRSATIHGALPGHRDVSAVSPAGVPADDLTRIRRIDRALAAALVARGVRSFAQIAAFGAADVRSLTVALGLGRRISQENWIEQAAMLTLKQRLPVPHAPRQAKQVALEPPASFAQRGGVPAAASASRPDVAAVVRAIAGDVARRVKEYQDAPQGNGPQVNEVHRGEAVPDNETMGESEPLAATPAASDLAREAARRIAERCRQPQPAVEAIPPSVTAAVVATNADAVAAGTSDSEPAVAASTADDLTLVRGIDAAARSLLAGLGVSRFEQIAAWCAADVRAASEVLAQATIGAQISRDGWIEQAAVLARGGRTRYAARIERGELKALVSRPDVVEERNAPFASWLAQHAASHAVPDAPPVVVGNAEAPVALVAAEHECDEHMREPSLEKEAQAMRPETPSPHHRPVVEGPKQLQVAATPVVPAIYAVTEPPQPNEAAAPWPPPSPPTNRVIDCARCEPVETAVADNQDVTVPAATFPIAAASIADRITAIELEAESLSLRSRPVVKGRWPTGASRPHAGFAEADVKIVRRDAQDAALEPVAAAPQAAGASTDFGKDDYAAYHGSVEEASVEIVRDEREWGADEGRGATAGVAADAAAPLPGHLRRTSALGPQHLIRVRRFLKTLTGE